MPQSSGGGPERTPSESFDSPPRRCGRLSRSIGLVGAGDVELRALLAPGHSPGSMCWHAPDLGAVFSGDTLFQGGPGATGRSFSDFPTILSSMSQRLGPLPADTVVYTGHGDTTTVGDEIVRYDDWVARGH